MRLAVSGLFLVVLGATTAGAQPAADLEIELVTVASGFDQPVDIAFPDDGSGRMFVVEKTGRVRVVDGSSVLPAPFLDLRGQVSTNSERGLLGLAFHPQYRTNGFFFVYYTNLDGNTRVARYRVSADPVRADPGSARVLLAVPQFASNHNGGDLVFGPRDGMLYISIGDGGGAGDPQRNGQDRSNLLGTIVRIDVDGTSPNLQYRIPSDNPFVGTAGSRGEIWAYGLRNPWRMSADRMTGDLFIGDVGQNRFEEIDFQPEGQGGHNFGWSEMEADACFPEGSACDPTGLTRPILSYGRADGRSVTGGYRYRGQDYPSLRGVYLFADFGDGRVFGASRVADGTWASRQLLRAGISPSAFGEDARGELYVADFAGGRVQRIRVVGGGPDDCPLPPGHPRFCRECGPCANAQGDCDSDAECGPGTVCMDNVGADFGFAPGIDVCTTPPFGCPWPVGHGRFCRDCGICDAGEGDCDSDDECRTGTTCVDNVGPQFGFAPAVDVCVAGPPPPPPPPGICPLPDGHPDFCLDCGPCRSGEGDCDADAECRSGLRCIDDVGPQFGFGMRVDVCLPP